MNKMILRMPKESDSFKARKSAYCSYHDRLNQYFNYKCAGSFNSWIEVVKKVKDFIFNEIVNQEISFADVFLGYYADDICDVLNGDANADGMPALDNQNYYYIPIMVKK